MIILYIGDFSRRSYNFSVSLSSADVHSSKMQMEVPRPSALAIDILYFSPPESSYILSSKPIKSILQICIRYYNYSSDRNCPY